MLNSKVIRGNDANRTKFLKDLFKRSDEMFDFWKTYVDDCLDANIRNEVKTYLADYQRDGSFSAIQIDRMIGWARKKNFIG